MKIVRETLNFEEDMDPYANLELGSHALLKIGDSYKVLKTLTVDSTWGKWKEAADGKMRINRLMINSILKLDEIYDDVYVFRLFRDGNLRGEVNWFFDNFNKAKKESLVKRYENN